MTIARHILAVFMLAFLLAACEASLLPPDRDGGTRVDGSAAPGDASRPDAAVMMDTGAPLVCDDRFNIAAPLIAGEEQTVRITDTTPYSWVEISARGPGSPTATWGGVEGSGPYTWSYRVRCNAVGVVTLVFTAEMGAIEVARCDVYCGPGGPPIDAGPPPLDSGTIVPPSENRFGIGLVSQGSPSLLDLAANLNGPGGHVKLIFPGVTRDTTTADGSWVEGVRLAYERDQIPVIRIGPPWGAARYRHQSDDGAHLVYTGLANAYRRVVESLRSVMRDGWPLFIEVHNEANLCYEWECDAGSVAGGWITYQQMAREYASFLRDVAEALHAIGDSRIRVMNGGLAPGGATRCECGGDGGEGGITAREFIVEMRNGVPDVFTRLDAWASHSYPATNEGWGFFAPYAESSVGLHYFEVELAAIGRDLPVYITETGWCRSGASPACPDRGGGSGNQVADWTVEAYRGVWLTHPSVAAVMPFQLSDPGWDSFNWAGQPVYDRVRAERCVTISGRCP